MGLFCLDLTNPQTAQSAVDTAIANLRLWQREHRNDGTGYSMTYLLDMAIRDAQHAIELIKKNPEAYKDLRSPPGGEALKYESNIIVKMEPKTGV